MAKSIHPVPEVIYVRASWPMKRYALSRVTIWRMYNAGKFPKPRYLPGGQRRWVLAELLAWEETVLAAGNCENQDSHPFRSAG